MKKLAIKVAKGLLVIVLFTGATVALSTSGVKTVSEAQAGVTEAQVVSYLEDLGYVVITAAPKPNTVADWICHTQLNGVDYWTTVYVQGNNIVNHGDTMYY